MNIVVDVVRHLVPLLPLYLLNGSIASYLLLTAFDLSLGLMLIVGTTRDRKDPTSVDPRSRWLVMRLLAVVVIAIFLAIVAAIVTLPIAAPAFIFGLANGVDWSGTVTDKHFWIPVAGMSLLAAAARRVCSRRRRPRDIEDSRRARRRSSATWRGIAGARSRTTPRRSR